VIDVGDDAEVAHVRLNGGGHPQMLVVCLGIDRQGAASAAGAKEPTST
jgi:hypothetical protein